MHRLQFLMVKDIRPAFFAISEIWDNALRLSEKITLITRVIRWPGIAFILALLPGITLTELSLLASGPSLCWHVAIQAKQRVSHSAPARIPRELLFAVLPSENHYKPKRLIDTVFCRADEQLSIWMLSCKRTKR